jgi:hypothetical protein
VQSGGQGKPTFENLGSADHNGHQAYGGGHSVGLGTEPALRRKAKQAMGTDCEETTANLLPASDRYLADRNRAPSKRRIGPAVKPLALVLCVGGLVTSVGYGRAPQGEGQSLGRSTAPLRGEAPGLRASLVIPMLIERLEDQDASVRLAAISALREMGPGAKTAIPALAQRLRDSDRIVGIDAAHALERMGPEAVPWLTNLLCDNDSWVRGLAVRTLEMIGPGAKAAIPDLTQRLWDADASVRLAAVSALRLVGPEAMAAIPALAQRLRDRDRIVAIDAAHALEKMGPEAAPCLTSLLRDDDSWVRGLAARTLEQIAKDAAPGGSNDRR